MRAKLVPIGPDERIELQSWLGRQSMPAAAVDRARAVLWLAEGRSVTEVAELMGWSRPTVHCWRDRFIEQGPAGLVDLPRSGRPKTIDRQHIIATTLMRPPEKYGVTHWSSRLLGKNLDIPYGVISKVWRENGIQPWRAETLKFSTDPELPAWLSSSAELHIHVEPAGVPQALSPSAVSVRGTISVESELAAPSQRARRQPCQLRDPAAWSAPIR